VGSAALHRFYLDYALAGIRAVALLPAVEIEFALVNPQLLIDNYKTPNSEHETKKIATAGIDAFGGKF